MAETIYCPKCGRKVGTYDGRGSIDRKMRCRKCNRQIIYHVLTGEVEMRRASARNTASGMVFW